MTPEERTSRTAKLFEQALAHSPARRSSFLMSECAGDEALYKSVIRLLDDAEVRTCDVLPDSRIAEPPILPDSVKERYENIEFLGRGGMGVVYRARDRELGTPVALKMLYPAHASDKQMVERLRNEIRLGREIAHKNVCRIHGLEQFDGIIFIEMEYVEGETLRSILDRVKGVSVPQALSWAREICEAIAAVHEKDVVHRDLKPGNIMIDIQGHIKVMDFGIARSIESDELTSSTSIGTPEYMSPEQTRGRAVGPASDIYSLGILLYELFTGRRRSQCNLPPRNANPYLPRHIDRTICRCLKEDPKDRFQSAVDVIASLTGGPDAEDGPRVPPWARFAALVTLLAAALVVGYLFTRPPPPPQHDGPVNAVAFRPDGRILASGSDDKTIKFWDVPSMRLLRTLADNDRAILTLAFSADGHWLASASQDKTIKIWEVGAGRLARTVRDKLGLSAVALSPDGRWLASTGSQTVRIWDLSTGRIVHVLEHSDFVDAVAFSADGRFLASGSEDEAAWVWALKTGDLVAGPLRHDDSVQQVAFSPDGRFMASGSDDQRVKIWSTTTWLTVQTIQHQFAIAKLSFNSTGNLLMSVTGDGTVALWERPTWKNAGNAKAGQDGTAKTWAFSPDGRNLAVGTTRGYVRLQRLTH